MATVGSFQVRQYCGGETQLAGMKSRGPLLSV